MNTKRTKPVIAVDIDDVVFPFVDGIAEYFNSIKGTTLSAKDFLSYHFTEVWGGTDKETNEVVANFLLMDHLAVAPIAGAKEALNTLKNYFEIYFVTARNGMFEAQTRKWLETHVPEVFQNVHFAGNPYDGISWEEKGSVCKRIGAEFLIDDNVSNLLSAQAFGVGSILYGNAPWVRADERVNDGMVRCADWEQVTKYLTGRR